MREELCFVQFMHPGGEHSADSDGFKPWNTGDHKRKFVEIQGWCQRNKQKHEGPIRFWTEWEPESQVIEKISEPIPHGPKLVCKPYYILPESYHRMQNTDPFVTGAFFYICCKQYANGSATQLRYLDRGSVILFGSHVAGKFVLDTVFVVDRWVDHNPSDYKKLMNRVPRGYFQVTLNALYRSVKHGCGSRKSTSKPSFRLYWGATVDNPIEGMFSYLPCKPAHLCAHGFSRPVIEIPKIITDNLKMGKRLNRGLSMSKVQKYWHDVRQQVKAKGLWIGTSSKMPKRHA